MSSVIQHVKAYRLFYVPTALKLKISARWLHCIYVFCVVLRINNNFPLHIINRMVFITEMESVYCAVRTESYIAPLHLILKGLTLFTINYIGAYFYTINPDCS